MYTDNFGNLLKHKLYFFKHDLSRLNREKTQRFTKLDVDKISV